MIRRIATSYEAHPHLAQELVQEIYFAIWRAFSRVLQHLFLRADLGVAHRPH